MERFLIRCKKDGKDDLNNTKPTSTAISHATISPPPTKKSRQPVPEYIPGKFTAFKFCLNYNINPIPVISKVSKLDLNLECVQNSVNLNITEVHEVDIANVSDHSHIDCSPPNKKSKTRKQLYRPIWATRFSWVEKKLDAKGMEKPYCKFCHKMLTNNTGHLKRHENTDMHQATINALKSQPEIFQINAVELFNKKLTQVKSAELKIIMFLLEHNLPFVLITPLIQLIKSIASDSSVVKDIKCGKTKATETTNTLILEEGLENTAKILRKQKFSLIIDETTDISTKKCLVLVVRFFDYAIGKVSDKFLGLIQLDNCDAKSIHEKILNYFESIGIPIKNLVGFAADNASVMMGNKSGVKTLLQQSNPELYVTGCICHSLHLCSSAAAKMVPQKIEILAKNIYAFFSHSPKRQTEYQQFQEYFNVNNHKILRSASTRWLSFEKVVLRILEQWVPLKHYFLINEFEADSNLVQNISNEMNDENKVYLHFLAYILNITNKINIEYQSEGPRIHLLLPTIKSYYKTILSNFIKPDFISDSLLGSINFSNDENLLEYDQIYIGAKADLLIKQDTLSTNAIQSLKHNCREYYKEICRQIKKRINFEDEVLVAVQVLNQKQKVPTLTQLIKRFPNLIEEDLIEQLDEEWRLFLHQEYVNCNLEFEEFWTEIFNLKNALGDKMYPNLINFIGTIISLPHSSATAERVFSQVALIKNKQRNSLLTCTVNSILMAKEMLKRSDATKWIPSKNLLMKYKK